MIDLRKYTVYIYMQGNPRRAKEVTVISLRIAEKKAAAYEAEIKAANDEAIAESGTKPYAVAIERVK